MYVDLRSRLLSRGMTNGKIAALLPAIEELRRADPDGAPPRYLLFWAARISTGDQQIELLGRLAAEEAETWEGKWAAGFLRQAEAIGKPFEFAFDDLLTGRRVTSQDLKGKVVVIDFWGTWCGICLAMKPDLKAAYEKYRDRGVEFIGVVLEDPVEAGSKEKVIAYLKEKKVDWPQWYQEEGWGGSDFPLSYGISGLPTVFIVDAEGKLRSLNGRPDQDLDKVVAELLAERDARRRLRRQSRSSHAIRRAHEHCQAQDATPSRRRAVADPARRGAARGVHAPAGVEPERAGPPAGHSAGACQ